MVRGLLTVIRSLTIRQKLIITICAGALFTVYLTSTIILEHVSKMLHKELISTGMIIAADLATQSVDPILYDDVWVIYRSVKAVAEVRHTPSFEYIMVLNKTGHVLAHSDPRRYRVGRLLPEGPFNEKAMDALELTVQEQVLSRETLYDITAPARIGTEILGFVRVGISDRVMRSELAAVKKNVFFVALLSSIGGVVVSIWVAYHITGPLQRVKHNIEKIRQGNIRDVFPIETTEKDEIGKLVDIFNDMAKGLKTQQEMDDHLARTEKLAMLGEFSAGLAHEIKNPLTSIKMLMQSATEKDIPLCLKDTEIIEQEINRIDRIVREFLIFAKPAEEDFQRIDINAVLREAIALIRPEIETANIALVTDLSDAINPIMARPAGLRQVVLNVMLNAVQAMGHDGALTVRSFQKDDRVTIAVSDTGPGIDAEHLPHLFDPFFTTREDGTGMGLAIVDRIVREHGGSVQVDTKPGAGSTFSIGLRA